MYFNRIALIEGIVLTKSNDCKEHIISHYWFFNHGFKFYGSACNGCDYLTMLCVNISDTAIFTVKNVDYRCVIHKFSKSEAINLLKNPVLEGCWYV